MPIKIKPPAIAKTEASTQAFSTCVQVGKHFYFSGVVAIDEQQRPDGDIEEQTVKVLRKMCDLLEAVDLTPNDVYKATVMLAGDMSSYGFLNKQWLILFGPCKIKPTRKSFAVAALPFDCAIEIEFEAVIQSEGCCQD